MPTYEYQCSCGLRFEASAKMEDYKTPKPCPDCGGEGERLVPQELWGVFQQEASGPGPQNTGVASFDAHTDRVIGQHAKQGWSEVEKRVGAKKKVLQENPDKSGEDLSRQPDGSYQVLSPDERGVHDRAQAINKKAIRHLLQQRRKPQTENGA